jgi:L1 cell adhesion molecule
MCVLCYGPADDNCYVCRDFKLYSELSDDPEEIDNTKFTCVDVCPEYAPKHALDESHNGTSTICATEALYDAMNKESNKGKMVGGIVGGIIAGVVIIGIIAVIVYYLQFERAKSQEATARIEAKLTGLDEIQPLAPTADKPDMTKLKIITESELQKYDVIGSGAFGTVYKGLWIPPDENVKVLVAIKVLREGSSADQNAELLEEARIMASVIHPNCTRIFAVCMTAQMMIVMPFVANGSLLDYIRRNQSNIGSKNLLNWAVQIARGMEYLQKRGIVHRDLAARNVLVHSENLVKITDFGLAKLLDKDQDKFKAAGGKMPIKWLALESIHHRIFTHQSDVWSYGVTLWELFTYGKRPYDNIHAYDIPEFLEKGQRLSQPSICTIDVYMIMIKCWMVDASNRPSFNYLAEEFAKMARDPGRYLMIQGDELLKLPEDQQYDAQELLAHETSDSAEIVTADDYLMPKTYDRDIDEKPEMEGSPYKKRKSSRKSANDAADSKFGGLAGKKGRPNDHHSSSRYISDPTGKGPKEDEQVAPASVGNDDYLEPTANAPAYMDIVDDRIGNTENKGASAENPEYFRNDKMTPKSNPSDYYNVGKPKVQSADSMKRSLLNESSV